MDNEVFSGAAAAVVVGLALAILLFVPFVWVNYRRDGRLTARRTLWWVAFLVYAVALWTYTLLPLPDPATITCVSAQTRPLRFIDDIHSYDISSARALLRNPAVLQFTLNVLLFFPLGLFLRRLWGRGLMWATVSGLAISLLIEVTQYTGVWGIYRCAYRFFDVDDLLANTLGAMAGGIVAAIIAAVHRSAERSVAAHVRNVAGEGVVPGYPGGTVDTANPANTVSRRRRLLGALCDLLVVLLLSAASAVAVNVWQVVVMGRDLAAVDTPWIEGAAMWVPFALTALTVLVTGRTVGDIAVEIRYVAVGGGEGDRGTLGRAGLPRQLLRFLGGIGGYQLFSLLPPLQLLFLLLSAILLWALKDSRGVPGLVSGTFPVSVFRPWDGHGGHNATPAGSASRA